MLGGFGSIGVHLAFSISFSACVGSENIVAMFGSSLTVFVKRASVLLLLSGTVEKSGENDLGFAFFKLFGVAAVDSVRGPSTLSQSFLIAKVNFRSCAVKVFFFCRKGTCR